jgi:L-fuculose-phosphate aldolase
MADPVRDLALAYRVLGSLDLGVGLLAHLTMREPGASSFWTYQLGQSVEEVRTADLIEVDFNLKPVKGHGQVNPNLSIHAQIYAARPDVCSIIHHHSPNGVALGAIGSSIVPFDQHAARWHDDIDLAEVYESPLVHGHSKSIAESLGGLKALLIKHHGVLVTGSCLSDAVVAAIELDAVCGVQLKAMAAGELHRMPAAEVEDVKQILASRIYYEGVWAYQLRRLTRLGLDQDIDDAAPATFDAIDVDLDRDYTPSRRES